MVCRMYYMCCYYVFSLLNNSRLADLCKSCPYYTEPLYMLENPIQYFFNTKADCCEVSLIDHIMPCALSLVHQISQRTHLMIKKEHYDWNLSECMGTTASTSTGKYYPDWLGDDICKNDGSAPEYMVLNPTMWLHDTLSDCCKVCL